MGHLPEFVRVRIKPATFRQRVTNPTTEPGSPDLLRNYHGYTGLNVLIDMYSNMYTNISRDIVIQQCTQHLDARSDLERLFSTSCVVEPLKSHWTTTSLPSMVRRQTKKGCSYGPKNTCEYADWSMDKIYQLANNSDLPINPYNTRPEFRARLRDDILMV